MAGTWDSLTPQEKADEFDASYESPREYAAEEFPNGAPGPTILPDHSVERMQYPHSG
jgi:hypothetical protein